MLPLNKGATQTSKPRKTKRAYVPKVRGCHECSQRRIDCDRTQPFCAKCTERGIKCSGFRIRYRFREDIAKAKLSNGGGFRFYSSSNSSNTECSINEEHHDPHGHTKACSYMIDNADSFGGWTSLQSNAPRRPDIADAAISPRTSVDDTLDPWKRYLLTYYSTHIALEMVVIDDRSNGWRHLVLPVARIDELVRDAVLAAAAFHFSLNVNAHLFEPNLYYQKAIDQLRQRQDLSAFDVTGKQIVCLALTVLLSAVMVCGSSDFRIMFKLLEAALDAVGGEEKLLSGELGDFVIKQIRKYRGYIAPFLSREDGVSRLSLTSAIRPSTANGWQCFRSYYNLYPQYSNLMDIIYNLNEQACTLYMTRALTIGPAPELSNMVELFRNTYEALPPDCPGEHILVWSVFLAACASTAPEHRKYFAGLLFKHYQRNGFRNVAVTRQQLQRVWDLSADEDWTQVLPELETFVV